MEALLERCLGRAQQDPAGDETWTEALAALALGRGPGPEAAANMMLERLAPAAAQV
jgi:hypothetical protein